MGFLDFFKGLSSGPNINDGMKQFADTPGAVLLDIREATEFSKGHIPNSTNLPVADLERITELVPEKRTPIFTYCLTGARSSRAAETLTQMGYSSVTNIGGINRYKGRIV